MKLREIKLQYLLILFFFMFPIDLCAHSMDSTTQVMAQYYAKTLLETESVESQFHKTYYNLDGSPHAHIFFCHTVKESNGNNVLTIALAPNRNHFPLLFYMFGRPFDETVRELLNITGPSRVIVCDEGIFIATGKEYIHWPSMQIQSEKWFKEKTRLSLNKQKIMADTFTLSEKYYNWVEEAWSQLDLAMSALEANEDTIEVMIPGVPNYPWYMNCGVICMTMILGFWNDNGYDTFIPGGNSATGYYWAVAEELRWNSFNESIFGTRIVYYAQAAEYGNHFDFIYSGHLGKKWEDYTSNIDTYQAPLFVIWQGPPYGQHATVGVGYKEEGAQRFMILHDTGIDYPTYINYDEYNKTETNTFCCHLPSSLAASKFPVINKGNCVSKEDDVLYLDSINFEMLYAA